MNTRPAGAGYSGTPLVKKLGIAPGTITVAIDAPAELEGTLGALPPGATLRRGDRGGRNLTLCFVRTAKDLARRIPALVSAAHSGGVWIAWPKQASGVATDLSEGVVRATGLAAGLVDHKVCAIDATWSGLRFALRKGATARG